MSPCQGCGKFNCMGTHRMCVDYVTFGKRPAPDPNSRCVGCGRGPHEICADISPDCRARSFDKRPAPAPFEFVQSNGAPALSTDSAARKAAPIASGVLDYFPLALADVARLSKIGNDKHNPNQPLHWSRGKSDDHADCIVRHMIERGTVDTDGVLHDAKVAWRALAQLQLAIERLRAEGVAYG